MLEKAGDLFVLTLKVKMWQGDRLPYLKLKPELKYKLKAI
jgi:hypothetical protein